MSFLLDVTEPSIHFRARQYCNSTGSKVATVTGTTAAPESSSSSSTSNTVKHSLFPSNTNASANNNIYFGQVQQQQQQQMHLQMPQLSIQKPMPMAVSMPMTSGNNAFSAMSRMIRTASASAASISTPSNLPSRSNTPFSSRPTTPDVSNVLDPFLSATLTANATTTSTSTSTTTNNNGRIATSLSPWMKPSVCDDDQMNKLVSFQL
ncbi:hypothetical protein BGZ65_008193 [Modicella reniformis]|uniref:Uncharacterized protein n=1 Tax=Modicella reniformis TaxID=1440133 RepID=A0A9P6M841_9FUNG|nr:hypothetical protein BGZ65_008193 [Modicella reniformis]